MIRSVSSRRKEWTLAIIAAMLAALVWGLTARSAVPDVFDSRQYAWTAWHLSQDGVFSEQPTSEGVSPGLGREPLYSAVLAVMLRVLPGLEGIGPECLARSEGCGLAAWRPALIANGFFIAITGLAVFSLLRLLQAGVWASWLGAAHIWLNAQAATGRGYLLSDHWAMMLVAVASLALAWAWQRGSRWPWLLPGLAFAALTLTKAIFLWFVGPMMIAALAYLLIRWRIKGRHFAALAVFALAYCVPVGGWMARNLETGGAFAISVGRLSIALSAREIFNDMSPAQYAAAFVYWTRGFGDGLAKDIFPENVWGPFEIYRDGGFYMTGQHRLEPEIDRLNGQGLSLVETDDYLSHRMMESILARPFSHMASTVPLFWRGVWVDEFIVFSLPAFVWLFFTAVRRRREDILLVLAPGLFSLSFYPLVSLNIPRYQLTAMPALAVAFGFAAAMAVDWWRARAIRRHRQTA